MITVSKNAAQEIKRLQISRNKLDTSLRIKINQGGCSGLFYELQFNQPQKLASQGDRQYQSEGIFITIDSESANYITNLEIDYSEDLMGGGFRFDNSKAVKNCNCGLSFSVANT